MVLLAFIACLHAATGLAQGLLAKPSLPLSGIGRVEAVAVQSDGKIVIGGAFTYVDAAGDVRVNIARFNSNGTLDTSFNFKATSTVNALAIIGNTLYAGGDFTGFSAVAGPTNLRNRLAAIDLTSLTVTSWNPNADGEVFALAVSGTTLYAGGRFTFVSSTQRIGAAAFDTSIGGAMTSWDPEPRDANAPPPVFQSVVYALAPLGSTMYVGGTFTQIGGNATPVARDNIGAVDLVNGLATSWDPVASNGVGTAIVRTIVPTASVVYLGGQFSGLNGIGNPFAQRLGIGAVTTAGGVATAFNPGMVTGFGTVRALVLDSTTLYAGGEFTSIGNAARNHAAGIDTSTPTITTLTRVSTTATATTASTAALANGMFVTIVGASPANYNGVQGPITVLNATQFTFPIGGSPTTPATGTITYASNSNATAFNPNLDGDVHSAAMNSGATSLLFGGMFLKAGATTNPSFGGFNKTSGALSIAGYVYDTAAVWSLVRQPDGKTILAGDYFMTVSGVLYRSLARLNADDTLDTSWNPLVDGQVVTAALGPIVSPATVPDTVLIGGTFTGVGGTARPRLAAVNLTTGAVTSFNANVNGPVQTLILDGTTLYIGGQFTSVGATGRVFVAAVNGTTGALQSWYPAGGADDFVEVLAQDAGNVYLGGSFFTVGGQSRLNVAKVAKATSIVDAWNPGTNEKVFGITVVGSTAYISGNFSLLNGQPRAFTGAVNASTGAVLAFNPNPDFIVLKVVPSPTSASTVYLAGAFINVNGTQVGNAAAVDATSGALKPYFPLLNDAVYDLVPDATRVMMGGVFVTAGVVPRLSAAAFSLSGVADPPTGLAATPGNASANVSFTPPVNNGGSSITGYTATSNPGNFTGTCVAPCTSINVAGLANGTPYTFTVTATNGVGISAPSAPSNSVIPGASSNNANLSNLVLSAGTLSPAFASGTLAYTAGVASVSNTITVTPTVQDPTATVKVNNVTVTSGSPSGPITLSVGSNPINVVVTAQDGTTTKTYTVTVTYILPSSCTYSLSPLDLSNRPKTAGATSITVTTPAGCPVTATSFQPWVVIGTIVPSGGTTTVNLSLLANGGAARGTTIQVAGRLFLVTQLAGP